MILLRTLDPWWKVVLLFLLAFLVGILFLLGALATRQVWAGYTGGSIVFLAWALLGAVGR